jgi:ketosteroid isomerase-like protein
MDQSPIGLVEGLYAARRNMDVPTMMAFCHDDIVFIFNADPDKIGSGDVLVGKAASLAHMGRFIATWEPISNEVGPLICDGNRVRARIEFKLRHRASGQVLSSTKRQEWTVRDGRIASLTEHLDDHGIAAFMRMAEAGMAEAGVT